LSARTVECCGHLWHAARSTVVFAEALVTQDRRGGCFDPDEICTLSGIEAQLRAAGIIVMTHDDPTYWRSRLASGAE
jgi:hypothetical protein